MAAGWLVGCYTVWSGANDFGLLFTPLLVISIILSLFLCYFFYRIRLFHELSKFL